MATNFKNMGERELTHYIYHASLHDEEWLQEKETKKQEHIEHFTDSLKGGTLHLDDDRGDLDVKGIENWEYTDKDPTTNIPFKTRFDTEEKFLAHKEAEIKSTNQTIDESKLHKRNYTVILEAKDKIKQKKIIIYKTEKEMNDKAKTGDRKLKNKFVIALIK